VTGLLTILGFSLYDTVVVFDKIRENTKNLKDKRTTYAAAANLAVNQTLVRSINTSIVALIPVGAILYVGAVQLGSGSMKDLALALFVGMAAGAYSSIFIATPLLVQLKSTETEIIDAEKRSKARIRQADRYAAVPVFTEDLPLRDAPDDDEDFGDDEDVPVGRPVRAPEATGRGRVVPPARGPIEQSNAAGRAQPTRRTRSKRGKK
jgi:preprotein translocase subunit SecF